MDTAVYNATQCLTQTSNQLNAGLKSALICLTDTSPEKRIEGQGHIHRLRATMPGLLNKAAPLLRRASPKKTYPSCKVQQFSKLTTMPARKSLAAPKDTKLNVAASNLDLQAPKDDTKLIVAAANNPDLEGCKHKRNKRRCRYAFPKKTATTTPSPTAATTTTNKPKAPTPLEAKAIAAAAGYPDIEDLDLVDTKRSPSKKLPKKISKSKASRFHPYKKQD